MPKSNAPRADFITELAPGTVAPGMDSRFQMVIVAGKRTKQLLQGAEARVEVDKHRRKGTSVALEEVKRGLVRFVSQADES